MGSSYVNKAMKKTQQDAFDFAQANFKVGVEVWYVQFTDYHDEEAPMNYFGKAKISKTYYDYPKHAFMVLETPKENVNEIDWGKQWDNHTLYQERESREEFIHNCLHWTHSVRIENYESYIFLNEADACEEYLKRLKAHHTDLQETADSLKPLITTIEEQLNKALLT